SSMLPGEVSLKYMLGQLYLHEDDFKNARALLEQVAKANVEESTRKHAESLLAQMGKMEEEKAKWEAQKSRGSTSIVTVSSDEPGKPVDPSSYLREVLRKPAAGETQLQGTLVKIECEPKGIFFVVKTTTGLLRLRIARFEDIELTTYDPKVKGDITCGERKPENTVIVCYVPNTDKRVKADGILKSLEFVPADFKLKTSG